MRRKGCPAEAETAGQTGSDLAEGLPRWVETPPSCSSDPCSESMEVFRFLPTATTIRFPNKDLYPVIRQGVKFPGPKPQAGACPHR